MDLNKYKAFLSVADSGSFTAAGRILGYSPAVKVFIKHMKQCLDQQEKKQAGLAFLYGQEHNESRKTTGE